ncbi:MAG: magnesium transporter [Bacillota bacterium]
MKDTRALAIRVRALLAAGNRSELVALLEDLHPADVADILERLALSGAVQVFGLLDPETAAEVLAEAENAPALVSRMADSAVAPVLDEMGADDVADLIAEVPAGRADRLLGLMEADEAGDVQELLEHAPDSAGGLMTTEFISLPSQLTVAAAIDAIRAKAPDAEQPYYIYVVDARGRLLGVLSLRELIIAPAGDTLAQHMETNVITVAPATDQEEAARLVGKYDLLALPVVDSHQRLLGIITVDDVIDVIQAEHTEDLNLFSGSGHGDVVVTGNAWTRTMRRLPWLVVCLFGDLLSGGVIHFFEGALQSLVALAYFIPVLMDMGGNVGTQSLAIMVRGLAIGQIDSRRILRLVFRELQVGALAGAITGTLVAVIASVWQGNPTLGLVVGIAMASTLTVAAAVGTTVPLVLSRLGVDPAIASGPFITTVIDVAGLVIYFRLAVALLGVI